MEGNSAMDPLTWDRSDLNGLSDKEYIPVKLKGFIWVDGRKMPTGREIGFRYFFRRF
jgi:hypothetical protein